MRTKSLVAICCFCFAFAFMLVLGLGEQTKAGSDPCCIIPCVPPLQGPGYWGFMYLNVCQTAWDPAHCTLREGGCSQ